MLFPLLSLCTGMAPKKCLTEEGGLRKRPHTPRQHAQVFHEKEEEDPPPPKKCFRVNGED